MRSDPLDTMATPASQSDSTDTEMSSSESNFSLSVGYFPSHDINVCEETGPESDSIHFLPPIQGAWLTESMGRPKGRYSQVQSGPEQFSKLSIALAWDIDLGPDQSDSVSDWKLNRENNWAGMKQKRNTHQTMGQKDCFVQKLERDIQNEDILVPGSLPEEDSQITTVSVLENTKTTTQSIQYENMSQDSPTVQLAENRHLIQPVMPQECQLTAANEMETWQYRKETPNFKRTSLGESSSLSTGRREDQAPASPGIQSLSCLNIGKLLQWLRKRVISSLSGKEQSQNKSTEGIKLLAQKRQCSCRERRVQPQDTPKSTYL
ncbi:uncharacterized protein C12orf71-like [Petaurus breviceps papuanus]|uniref:uncharacterized protein C12orf71-like n=1 Tax=Petaurus breviceps papuanus TaxID=3040969 RepID=UPI0036DDAE16